MSNHKEVLWNVLENLRNEHFKNFQWFLKQNDIIEGFSAIAEARLERADRQDTVDLMVQKYGCRDTVEITITILEKIGRNDLAQCLSRQKDLKTRDAVLLKWEYNKKKAELEETRTQIKMKIQERQTKIWEIKDSAELSKKSANRQIQDNEQVFTLLLESVKRILADLNNATKEKQEATQKQAEGFIQELEKEISELTERSTEVEQLSHIEDHHEFLQSCSLLKAAPPTKNWTDVSIAPPSYGRFVGTAVNQLKGELSKETEKLLAKAKLNRVQQFAVDVTLDPDSANPYLVLSDDAKQVYFGDEKLNLPDKPERFDPTINVLGKQSISSGRFYYEVQVGGNTSWDLGVVRESINRKGSITAKPENGYWTICLRNGDKYRASAVQLRVKHPPEKVGVFVDYNSGSVSFYDVDSAELLHCFSHCSFNGKLYPFFSPSLHRGGNRTPLTISSVNYTD
ncbi:pyrin-like [Anabas testudineus]|uniref:B30.2/SPRY domain-containing protein n=1 Tax=Anabas testudineus TaxID=64144 RepID=A0A7N6A1V8_ANATE|nr:pyrin-like [Anabas testudineus]